MVKARGQITITDVNDGQTIWTAQAFKRITDSVGSDKPSLTTGITSATSDFGNGWRNEPITITQIGSGTSTSYFLPSYYSNYYSLTQQIYTAAEIGAGTGTSIISISFWNTSSYITTRNYDIYLVNTSKTEFSSNTDWVSVDDSKKVFSGGVTMKMNEWTMIPFDTPFEYTGGNVIVVVHDKTGSNGNILRYLTTSTSGNQASSKYQGLYTRRSTTDYNVESPPGNEGQRMMSKNQIVFCFATDNIYTSVATVEDGMVQGTWSTPVAWNGKDGKDGKDGADGNDGQTVRTVQVYQASRKRPATPTGSSVPPYGWLAVSPTVTQSTKTVQHMSGGNETHQWTKVTDESDSHYGWYSSAQAEGVDGAFVRDRISFYARAGECIAVEIASSTEEGYDLVYVGGMDETHTGYPANYSEGDYGYITGVDESMIVVAVAQTSGQHFVDVVFCKDSSDEDGEDTGWYRIVDSFPIWVSETVLTDGVGSGSWTLPARWNGVESAEYRIVFVTAIAYVTADGIAHGDATWRVHCIEGENDRIVTAEDGVCEIMFDNSADGWTGAGDTGETGVPTLFDLDMLSWDGENYYGDPDAEEEVDRGLGSPNALLIRYSVGGVVKATEQLPFMIHGQKGDKGELGKAFYPAGDFKLNTEYVQTEYETPLVHIKNDTTDEWYYLVAATNKRIVTEGGITVTTYVAPPNEGVWKKAMSEYEVIMTKALFTDYASMASAVIVGDFMFSKNGSIGGVEYINGTDYISGYPAYMRFLRGSSDYSGDLNLTGLISTVTVRCKAGEKLSIAFTGSSRNSIGTVSVSVKDPSNNQVGTNYSDSVFRASKQFAATWDIVSDGLHTITFTVSGLTISNASYTIAGGGFVPNWYVNLLTGDTWEAKGNFRVEGSKVIIKGATMNHSVLTLVGTLAGKNAVDALIYEATADNKKFFGEDVTKGGHSYSYYGMKGCNLLYDQVFVGSVVAWASGYSNVSVTIHIPPPHLFIGQRLIITNASELDESHPLCVKIDYIHKISESGNHHDYLCLTGETAYFERSGSSCSYQGQLIEDTFDFEDGVPLVDGAQDKFSVSDIRQFEKVDGVGTFTHDEELYITSYDWVELTAVCDPEWVSQFIAHGADAFDPTNNNYQENTKYHAYWMVTRWKMKD